MGRKFRPLVSCTANERAATSEWTERDKEGGDGGGDTGLICYNSTRCWTSLIYIPLQKKHVAEKTMEMHGPGLNEPGKPKGLTLSKCFSITICTYNS